MRRCLVFISLLAMTASVTAEPFFGYSSLPATTAFNRSVRVHPERAMLLPQTLPRTEQPSTEDDDEPATVERSSGGGGPTVSGNRAVLKRGIAYAPANAPMSVKRAIWAANELRRKPYRYGGGHASFFDRGYDCSGTVSFALHGGGLLTSPMNSSSLAGYGKGGRGKWITVYARRGHAFAVIAGLRLDTTGFSGGHDGPRWRADQRSPFGFSARHPVGL